MSEEVTKPRALGVEKSYGDYYDIIRVAENKAYTTLIFHGELVAFRTELLRNIGGFPEPSSLNDHLTPVITGFE